jgi:hypothetical protein
MIQASDSDVPRREKGAPSEAKYVSQALIVDA